MECRVGLPCDGITRWRCDICSLLNIYSNDQCIRCKEPMSLERKQKNILLAKKKSMVNNHSIHSKSHSVSSSSTSSSSSSTSLSNASQNNKTQQRIRRRSSIKNAGKSIISQNHKQEIQSNNKSIKNKRIRNNTNYKMKKLVKEDLSEKHLGYKSNKKRSINTMVRSKLNHDTASYRAKVNKNPNDKKSIINGMKKGVQYATINDLTRNGFQTTLSNGNKNKNYNKPNQPRFKQMSEETKASIRKLTDERPVTPPPRGVKGKTGKRTLIDRLQAAHSGEIMANMRHGGRYMRPQKKQMGSATTKYTL